MFVRLRIIRVCAADNTTRAIAWKLFTPIDIVRPMFTVLRARWSRMGVKSLSAGDLERVELDSADSLGSIAGSAKLPPASSDARDQIIRTARLAKAAVAQSKLPLIEFIDMLRDRCYPHVSLSLLDQFMHMSGIIPKPHYLYQLQYFLYYATYYHHARATVDVIDPDMIDYHRQHLADLQAQLKCLRALVEQSRGRQATL